MINRFLCLSFALLIALTSQSLALARGQSHVAGQMVLCIGQTTVVVLIDENGTPVEHPHICPDCTMTLMVAVAGCTALPQPFAHPIARIAVANLPVIGDQDGAVPQARGPPQMMFSENLKTTF